MKTTFKHANALTFFLDKLEQLTHQNNAGNKIEQASRIIAAIALKKFLDKHRLLRHIAYLEKPKNITIPAEVALAIFILQDNESTGYFFPLLKLIAEIDQKMLT